ncbi:MAG TPA: alpha/beta fold hydrolase [Anaerolineales bacterium]|nr:alpha/beta fold hydrolase [Anaerolineales bacterium]
MSTDEILKAGIAAAESGDLSKATALFAQVVQIDPSSEKGWLGLGFCISGPDQREYCFRRVLALNPNNSNAKEQLARLSRPDPNLGPTQIRSAPAAQSVSVPRTAKTAAPLDAPNSIPEERAYPVEQESPPAHVDAAPVKVIRQNQAARPKKKSNVLLAAVIVSVPILILCGLGLGYGFSRAKLYSSVAPPQPTLPLLTQANTPTPTSPLATSSPTANPPTPLPSPVPTVAYTPAFENATCQFSVPAAADVNCGYLIVPEDRTSNPSHTIKLAVAVYHSRSQNPSEPVLFLQGGPGAEAVKLSADAYSILVAPFLPKRDFIVFDQRGTGLSEPSLDCDELTKLYSQDVHGLIDASTRDLVYSNAFLSCNGLMQAQGINLRAYTTVESAADVRDLLTVLKYPKADLYGASYGTRLAQVVMRNYPEIVNNAVLDSVVPVDTSLFGNYSNSVESGLKTLFTDCAVDPQCNAAYPNLETTFWDLVKQLDANPVTVTSSNYPTGTITQSVTGETVMNVILGSIKESPYIATAPQSIYRFKNGDFSTLVLEQASLPFAFEGISPGLFINMTCHEQILSTTPAQAQTDANSQIIRDYAWLPFYGDIENIFKTCKSWGATAPAYGEDDPTVSNIPSLIITGSFDPTTPPAYAKQVAARLSHSYYFEFPNLGHTPTAADSSGCAMSIVEQFLDNPSTEPDRSCLDKLKTPVFVVPYTGSPALALKAISSDGIKVDVPKDWHVDAEGFYDRGNSPFDTTAVGLLKVPTSTSNIEKLFSLKAFGYQGLDSPLIPAGQRRANGFNWKLYTSSSYGRPVDVAMVDDGKSSIVIVQFCNKDEHDALYQTVFLPMVDSATP